MEDGCVNHPSTLRLMNTHRTHKQILWGFQTLPVCKTYLPKNVGWGPPTALKVVSWPVKNSRQHKMWRLKHEALMEVLAYCIFLKKICHNTFLLSSREASKVVSGYHTHLQSWPSWLPSRSRCTQTSLLPPSSASRHWHLLPWKSAPKDGQKKTAIEKEWKLFRVPSRIPLRVPSRK